MSIQYEILLVQTRRILIQYIESSVCEWKHRLRDWHHCTALQMVHSWFEIIITSVAQCNIN